MQAVNHISTALLVTRAVPKVPLLAAIIAVQAVEYLWVMFNLLGIERTQIALPMRSVADVHLVHLPFSHSILGSLLVALITWLLYRRQPLVATALAIGALSHILLDLTVHARDIPIAPFMDGPLLGTGLYAHVPLAAFAVEATWGLFCWRVFRGSWSLLAVILGLNALSLPSYSVAIDGGEAMFGGNPMLFTWVIFAQILISSALVWWFARPKATDAR